MPVLTVRNMLNATALIVDRGSVDVYQRPNVDSPWTQLGTLSGTELCKEFTFTSGYIVRATPNPNSTSGFIFYKWCTENNARCGSYSCGMDCPGPNCGSTTGGAIDHSYAMPIFADLMVSVYFVQPCSALEYFYRSLLLSYDVNRNGKIDHDEMVTASIDYLDEKIGIGEYYVLQDFYVQNCTLSPSTLATITISPTSASINARDTQIFTITAYDQFNVPMPNATVTWVSTNGSAGTLTPISTVTDVNGRATANFTAADVQTNIQTLIYAYSGTIGGWASSVTVTPVQIFTSVDLYPTSTTINVGGTQQFTATCKDQFGNAMACPSSATWVSNNTSIATVSSVGTWQGTVTGVSQGTTTITATISGVSRSATVTVTPVAPVLTSMLVSLANSSIGVGNTTQASVICKDQFNNVMTCPAITWSSDNSSIATVNSSGVVTGVSAGITNIRATSGSVSGTAPVTVSTVPPVPILTSIIVSLANPTIGVTGTTQASAVCKDQFGDTMSCPTIIWASSNTSVATVNTSTGVVTGASAGVANIIATSGSVSGSAQVTVTTTGPVLNEINVLPINPTVSMGRTQQFFAVCKDQIGNSINCPIITWDTTDHDLGIISPSGVFTALASSGTVTVTATSGSIVGSSIVTLSTAPPVQAGFGATEMVIVAGLAIGAIYMMTRPKTLPSYSEKE